MIFRALLTSLALAAGLAIGLSQAQDDGINWLGDYQEALKAARETGKPIFVEFRCEA
jgi:hypothetical protein